MNTEKKSVLKTVFIWIFGFMAITACSFILAERSKCIINSDSLWHFKQGEKIVSDGILKTDTFSMHEGLKMTAHEWLYDVISFGIEKLCGYNGLLFMILLCSVGGFSLCIFSDRKNKYIVGKSIILIAFIFMGFGKSLSVIPDTIAVIFLILQLYLLKSKKMNLKKKMMINLVFVILLANLHGGMMSAYIIQYVVYIFVDIITASYTESFKKDLKGHVLLLTETIIAGLINPYGINIYLYGFHVIGSEASKVTSDWLPFSFNSMGEILIVMFFLLISILGNKRLLEFRKSDLQIYGICTLWFIFTLAHNRFINIFVYVFIMTVSVWSIDFISDKVIRNNPKLTSAALGLCTVVLGIIIFISTTSLISKRNLTVDEIVEDYVSDDIERYIEENESVVFNDQSIAGYLIYKDIPVFIDGRTDLYVKGFNNNDIAIEYQAAYYSPEIMKDICKKYGINTLIVKNNTVLHSIYINSTQWKKQIENTNVTLFSLVEENDN